MKKTLVEFLLSHGEGQPTPFHMPGHKGSGFYKRLGYNNFLSKIMDCDITEIPGADNLFSAEGVIADLQDRYAHMYGARKSKLLINGTSGGIIAAILAAVPRGGKLIMARNSHKSVFNALILGNITPVYIYPGVTEEYGLAGSISPERIRCLLDEHPDTSAVILPSPNYYGICSDIREIAAIVHSRGKILIVDQAHGAHLKLFSDFRLGTLPESAEDAGADISVNSIHKTLASFTQSAVININSDRISEFSIDDKLQCIQSSSPSYLLMASLDINATILEEHGQQLLAEWDENLRYFYEKVSRIKGVHCFSPTSPLYDYTKLNFTVDGFTGDELEKILKDKYRIFIELCAGDLVMCMSGIGSTHEHMNSLLNAIAGTAAEGGFPSSGEKQQTLPGNFDLRPDWRGSKPEKTMYYVGEEKQLLPLSEAIGFVCAASVTPYPPGIPLICPGELIDERVTGCINELRDGGNRLTGLSDKGEILCCPIT